MQTSLSAMQQSLSKNVDNSIIMCNRHWLTFDYNYPVPHALSVSCELLVHLVSLWSGAKPCLCLHCVVVYHLYGFLESVFDQLIGD